MQNDLTFWRHLFAALKENTQVTVSSQMQSESFESIVKMCGFTNVTRVADSLTFSKVLIKQWGTSLKDRKKADNPWGSLE